MVKHPQPICQQKQTNFLGLFDHFLELALKRLTGWFKVLVTKYLVYDKWAFENIRYFAIFGFMIYKFNVTFEKSYHAKNNTLIYDVCLIKVLLNFLYFTNFFILESSTVKWWRFQNFNWRSILMANFCYTRLIWNLNRPS